MRGQKLQQVKLPFGQNRGEGLPAQSAGGGMIRLREREVYGVVASLRGGFGFIQPIFTEEQVYLSEREFYTNIKVGDRVAYIDLDGAKGRYAEAVRFLVPTLEKVTSTVPFQGVVGRSTERHRSSLGFITLDVGQLPPEIAVNFGSKFANKILFRAADVVSSSMPRSHFLECGDLVEFSVSRQHNSGIFFATDVKLVQLKRHRELALQVKRMLEAGAVREFGVVATVRNNEFGFLQAQDRKDEVYFKVDDVVGLPEGERLKEGTELEFFVITEIVKGKVSDRAIHLKAVPSGTVQLEIVVGVKHDAVVVLEPCQNDENPGSALLGTPIDLEALSLPCDTKEISRIDLWQRCLPEELVCKIGDMLQLNTHYYRPEKLFFAREVALTKYNPIGRDSGVICGLKDNFGFITSDSRRMDLYFKSNMVMDNKGNFISAQQLKVGTPVEFDLSIEDGKMLRAVRVQLKAKGGGAKDRAVSDRYVIKRDVLGVVVRNTLKKDALGLVKLFNANDWLEAHAREFVDPDIRDDLNSFDKNAHMTTLELLALPNSLRKHYEMVASRFFSNLKVEESMVGPVGSQVSCLKITKIDAKSTSPEVLGEVSMDEGRLSKLLATQQKDGSTLPFARDDYVSVDLGVLQNDLEVLVDICFDKLRGKLCAKRVRLTDEPVDDAPGEQFGVMEMVMDKGDKFGYVRCIPSNEKLVWQALNGTTNANVDVAQGKRVSFEIRRRGGLRSATRLKVLTGDAQAAMDLACTELKANGRVTALIVDNNTAVIVDTTQNAALQNQYASIPMLMEAFLLVADVSKSKQWEKQMLTKDSDSSASGPSSPLPSPVPGDNKPLSAPDALETDPKLPSDRVHYKPKYFAPSGRLAVPVRVGSAENQEMAKEDSQVASFKAGDLVECDVTLRWTQSMLVTQVIPKVVLSQGVKKEGTITRLKVKLGGVKEVLGSVDIDVWMRNHLLNTEMTEISLTEGVSVVNFYCPSSEVSQADDSNREIVQLGDQINFWAVPEQGNFAFAPTLIRKQSSKDSALFNSKRIGFNSELKEQMSKLAGQVMNLITMAKGPPTDAASGFEANWRAVDREAVKSLPWAHLLGHLET